VELRHQFTVPAAAETTWATFMDLAGVASCFPGATVTSADSDRFEGTCKVKLGPIALMYTGSGTFMERDDAKHHAVIQANGKDKRGNGTAGATVTISLAESSDAGTDVDVTTDLSVTGKPAQFGRGVMQDVSDKLLAQFVACLEQRFAEPADVAGGSTEPEAAGAEAVAPAAVTNAPGPVAAEAAVGSAAACAADAPPAAPAPQRTGAAPAARNVERTAFGQAGAGGDDALDLGSTVLPVLLRSYAPQLVAGAVGFVLGMLVARRRRR